MTTQSLSVLEGTEAEAKAHAMDYALDIRPGFGIVGVLSQKYEVEVK